VAGETEARVKDGDLRPDCWYARPVRLGGLLASGVEGGETFEERL